MTALWSALVAISFASGLNIYATVLALGLLGRYQYVELPGQLTVLGSTPVLAVAAVLYVIEFVADKVPYIDSTWDTVHTVIRPIGAAVLAYSAVGTVHPVWQVVAALVAGGVALTSHSAKASARAAANLSPEPFSNWILSFGEDIAAVGLVWLATQHPWIALTAALVLMTLAIFIIVKFSRLIGRAWRGISGAARSSIVVLAALIAGSLAICSVPASSIAQNTGGAPRPAPRWPDGRIRLSQPAGDSGLWGGSGRLAINPKSYEPRSTLNAPIHVDNVPLQPWALELLNYRHLNFLKDEPYTRCKPSPGPRLWTTAYGFEIVDTPDTGRIYVIPIGGPHSFHTIYMDGRRHPEGVNLVPSYFGHSIGGWEGDTLVVDTIGFTERAWMNRDGLPSTDRLHLIERLTRTDFETLKYEVTIDDLGAYTGTWTTGFSLRLTAGTELFEYLCQDNNQGPELMIGAEAAVDRSSPIVP